MEDYCLPAPLVGMLRASKLTGKPIVKTELLSTKLHVTLSWDLATSAPRRTKKRQSTKAAKPAPTTQQPAKSSHHRQPPAPTPAPATPAPTPTVIRRPCPETLPPQVAAGRVGDQQTNLPASPFRQPANPATPAATPTKHCSQPTPTPTPAAKLPAPSPDASTEDESTKLQRREPPATINDARLIANADVSATDETPPSYDDFAIRIHDGSNQTAMMKKYHYQKCYKTKLPNNDEVNIIHCQRKNRDGATLNVDLRANVLRIKNPRQDRHTEKWYLFKGPTSKYHHEKWWNLLDSYMSLQHVNAKCRDVISSYMRSAARRGNISRPCPLPETT